MRRLFKALFGSTEPDLDKLLDRQDAVVRIARENGDVIEITPVSAMRGGGQPPKSPQPHQHHRQPNGQDQPHHRPNFKR